MSVLSLVTKPPPSEEIRRDVCRILREALVKAEAGEVAEAIVILKWTDGNWSDERSATVSMSEAVGKLEIVKQAWIASYLTPLTPPKI
jgi:hypothetical protein